MLNYFKTCVYWVISFFLVRKVHCPTCGDQFFEPEVSGKGSQNHEKIILHVMLKKNRIWNLKGSEIIEVEQTERTISQIQSSVPSWTKSLCEF